MRSLVAGAVLAVSAVAAQGPAIAGSENGNFMIRLQGTYVGTQDKLNSLTLDPGAVDLKAAGFGAKVSDEFIPTATLTYFFNPNVAVELLCCFGRHDITLSSPVAGLNGKVADAWIFPPALTLQYHFTGMGAFKPYIGAGAQWIHFFKEKPGDNPLNSTRVDIKDAFGPVLQAGFDIGLGGGWYLNADVKKSWMDTKVTWSDALATPGVSVTGKADLDPLIVSAGIGYRFNLEDIFGGRRAAPLK